MVYVKHDFYSNLLGGLSTDEVEMVDDLMIDQIAFVLAKQSKEVVEVLRLAGVNVTDEDVNIERLAELIATNVSSPKVRAGLAYIISVNEELMQGNGQPKNLNGNSFKNLFDRSMFAGKTGGKNMEVINNISKGLGETFGSDKVKEAINGIKEAAEQKNPNIPIKSKGVDTKKILIGVAAVTFVALTSYVVYVKYYKKKK